MSLYDEYEAYTLQYRQEYGERTIVLYRCGGFFEIYSIDDGLVDMRRVCDILNIQSSRRNKNIAEVNRSNMLMAGFPLYTLQKFVNLLVENNYTVVIVDQVSEAPKPKRAVTAIISPGTDTTNVKSSDANNLACLYVDDNMVDFKTKKNLVSIGASVIDLSTGKCSVMEVASTAADPYLAMDEVYRFIRSHNPREIVVIGVKPDHFESYLEIADKCVHYKSPVDDVFNLTYQSKILKKTFPSHGLLSVIEFLDLERLPLATVSFVYLLQFSYQHNELILNHIQKPVIEHVNKGLVLSYNCSKHLNLTCTGGLLQILNTCKTACGKRLFKEWLLHPLVDGVSIAARHDAVDRLLQDKLFSHLETPLQDIYDIERLCRRMDLKTFNPSDLAPIITSITAIEVALEMVGKELTVVRYEPVLRKTLREVTEYVTSKIDLSEAQKYNVDNMNKSFFLKDVFPKIDDLEQERAGCIDFFHELSQKLGKELYKVDHNQVDGYHLTVTSKRYEDTKSVHKNIVFSHHLCSFSATELQAKHTGSNKSVLKLTHPCFKGINERIIDIQSNIEKEIKNAFTEFVEELNATYRNSLVEASRVISEIDVLVTYAHHAFKHRYHRPHVDSMSERSYIKGRDLRHPIIERMNQQVEYVVNDVELGTEATKGVLLYGTNMVGKSAYMKSIGLTVIMAQCGMFVPCQHMVFHPFRQMFSRIPSGDDLYKGQSTFAVEISELRNILGRADKHSLVIGDELASGTESVSAISIVAAGIIQLLKKEASFVFATHLHDLVNLKEIQKHRELGALKIFHLSVVFDDTSGKLVFNRKLQPGQGHTIYGLEVCRALDLSSDFLSTANEFRHELLGLESNIVSTKKSVYNKMHYVDVCDVCGNKAEEVHHIREQMLSNENGFIGDRHKNHLSNLMNVCEECHDKIHRGDIRVMGYQQTSEGVKLTVVHNVGDRDRDISNLIKEWKEKEGLSIAKIKERLSETIKVNYTTYKINKALKERV